MNLKANILKKMYRRFFHFNVLFGLIVTQCQKLQVEYQIIGAKESRNWTNSKFLVHRLLL